MNERTEAHLERGRKRFESGDLEGAIDDFTEAIRMAPDSAPAWVARASARAKKLDLDGAIADIRKALDLAGDNWDDRARVEGMLQKLEIKAMTLPESIREFAARTKYRELTKEIIASIPDDKLVQAVVDHVADYRIKGDLLNQRQILDGLPSGLSWMYAMYLADAEIQNGGFTQFFYNSSGNVAFEALEGFRRIGSPRERLLTRGLAILKVTTRAELDKVLDRYRAEGGIPAAELGKLDEPWYALPDDGSFKVAYVRANIEQFV